ncbi:unnamed protein product [Sphagnum jensenii]
MAYLHKQGIFHGDLKASNVLVNHHGGHIEGKIAGFGVSQTVQLTKRFDTSKHNDGDIASGSSVYSKFIVFWNHWDNWLEGTRGV